jgi:hypothetical protein
MRDLPISVLASFPPPNYTNPETRGPTLVIINGTLIAIVVAVVALRMWTRIVIKRWVGSDDILIVIATVSLASITATSVVLRAESRSRFSR